MSTTNFIRLFFLLAIIILCCAELTGQIKIKERIEISPGKISKDIIEDGDLDNYTLPGLNHNDFALENGNYIENYDQIYNDHIFIPRIGGVIKTAWDIWYSYNWFVIQNGLHPEENRLLVFGPDGTVRYKFNVGDFWDSDGHLVAYFFDDEKYCQDRAADSAWQERDPTYHPDTTKWGWKLNLNLEIPVTAWEPLRFRLYYGTSGIVMAPSVNFVFTDTFYPSEFTGGWGRMTFPCTGNLCSFYYGNMFKMLLDIDSSKAGNPPLNYSYNPEFFIPDSGMYRVIIGGVLPNVNGTLSIIDTTSHVLVTDIRSHQGDTILVGPYGEGTIIKFDLDGMAQRYGAFSDYNGGAVVFESWADYDFQDAAIWFEYAAGQPDHLELWSSSETIYYGDTLDIDVVPCDKDSLFSPLGYDYLYEYSIELTGETSNYVELIYDDIGSSFVEHIPSDNRRGHCVRLAANKLEPDSVVDLTFRLKAFYTGGGGGASSGGTVQDGQREIKVLSKKSSINQSKQTVNYKDGKITLSFGKQKREINRFDTKKLQAMSATIQPKKRKIGHMLVTDKSKSVSSVSLSKKKVLTSTMEGETETVVVENPWGIGIEPPIEIMLGETQYYGARLIQTRMGQRLQIERAIISDDGIPFLLGGENNVDYVCVSRSGDECGVYYEKQYPVWENDKFIQMKHLSAGLIRLVGRYWNSDPQKEHIVTLLASSIKDGTPVFGHVNFKVKKPDSLGKTNNKSLDVKNSPVDIDDLCITLGGKIGIPPQLLKAHIHKESPLEGGFGFAPPYRFEPFTKGIEVVQKKEQRERWETNPYWVTETTMGTGGAVPSHNNLLYMSYYTEPVTIWKVVEDYSQISNTSPPRVWTIFARRLSDGKLDFKKYGYKTMQEEYDKFLNRYNDTTKYKSFTDAQKNDSARIAFIDYLKNEYEGGLDSIIAQTRIASSYGLTQLLYETALEAGYTKTSTNLPENLNINSIYYPVVENHYLHLLKNVLGTENWEKSDNWPKGYERTFKEMVRLWNPRFTGYSNIVFQYIKNYLPE